MSDLARRLTLMVLTDAATFGGRSILEVIRAALAGGATAVQLRMKESGAHEMVELGRAVREETRGAGAIYLVNDRLDVALVTEADGVHLGADDLPLSAARRIAPPGFLLGRSIDSGEEAEQAESEGADYLGVGPAYATLSKRDVGPVLGPAGVGEIRRMTRLPLVAIGGIDLSNVAEVADAGADGVAVIRVIMQAEDPEGTTRELLRRFEEGRVAVPRGRIGASVRHARHSGAGPNPE